MLKTLLIIHLVSYAFTYLGMAHSDENISFNFSYNKLEKSKDSNGIYKKFILKDKELRFEYRFTGTRKQNDKIGKVNITSKDLENIKKILEQYQLYKDYNHNSLEKKMMSYKLSLMLLVDTPENKQSKLYNIQIEGGEKLLENTVFNDLEVLIERLDKIVVRNK